MASPLIQCPHGITRDCVPCAIECLHADVRRLPPLHPFTQGVKGAPPKNVEPLTHEAADPQALAAANAQLRAEIALLKENWPRELKDENARLTADLAACRIALSQIEHQWNAHGCCEIARAALARLEGK